MKYKYTYLLLIITFILSPVLLQSNVSADPTTENDIQRLVYITDWGATVVNDTITLYNTRDTPLTEYKVGFPLSLKSYFRYVQAKDEADHNLATIKIEDEDNHVLWIHVKFRNVGKGETYQLNVLTVFSDLVTFYLGSFKFNFIEAPILMERVETCNVTIVLPLESTINIPENHTFTKTSYNGLPALNAAFVPLNSYEINPLDLTFQSITVQLFKVHWAERRILFKAFGGIRFEDSYSITNLSTSTSQIEILLPNGSYNIMAYDNIGSIWVNPQKGDRMTVSPRYGAIKSNESFTFTLKYDVPNDYLSHSSIFGPYDLNLTLLTPQPFIIYKLETEILLPKGFFVDEINQTPNSTKKNIYEIRYYYNITGITPFNDLNLKIRCKYDSFGMAIRPTGWIAMIEATVCALYITLRKKRIVTEEKVTVPVDLLKKVTELTDEKIGLRADIESLNEKIGRKAISKKDFRRRRRSIEARISTINRLLIPLKTNLTNLNPRYGEILSTMDKAEAEMEATITSIRNIRTQYRMGRIVKDTYLSVLQDLKGRLEKAKTRQETLNITLKEEAG